MFYDLLKEVKIMKNYLIVLSAILFMIIIKQYWHIEELDTKIFFLHRDKEFWQDECAHYKIYGKGRNH